MSITAIAIGLALQAAAPAAAPGDQQVRQALAARGMSAAGVETIFTIQRRHGAAVNAIIQRGRTAEAALHAALAKRPVDIDGFARSITARNEAGLALQREGADVAVEQLRALTPDDRVKLAGILSGPAAAGAPARR